MTTTEGGSVGNAGAIIYHLARQGDVPNNPTAFPPYMEVRSQMSFELVSGRPPWKAEVLITKRTVIYGWNL